MNEYVLTDVADIITGVTPSSKSSDNWGTGIPFLTPTDISNYDFSVSTDRRLSKNVKKELESRVISSPGLAVVCIGSTLGKLALIRTPTLTNQQINTIVPDPKKIDLEYLFYYFQLIGKQLWNLAGGSAVPLLPKKVFETVVLSVPSLPEQKEVAKKLSNIDKLIEVNKSIIALSDETMKAIYNRYFTVKEDSWHTTTVSDLAPILTGKKDANFASASGSYNFFTCAEEILKCDSYAFDGKAILLAGNGNFNIKLYTGKFDAYQRTYVIIPENIDFFFQAEDGIRDRIASLSQGSRGSIVKFITRGDIADIPVQLPDKKNEILLAEFNKLTDLIQSKKAENEILETIKKELMPALLNRS